MFLFVFLHFLKNFCINIVYPFVTVAFPSSSFRLSVIAMIRVPKCALSV